MISCGKLASISTLILILFVSSNAQWLDDVLTESDWEYLYSDGSYDYNSYLILKDISLGMISADTADLAVNTLALTNSQSSYNGPFWSLNNEILSTSKLYSNEIRPGKLNWQIGNKYLDNQNIGYIHIAPSYNIISLDYKSSYENNTWTTDHRSFKISLPEFELTAGNYWPRIGMGLAIGRYDFRPIRYGSGHQKHDDLIFPVNSYYNGLYVKGANFDFLYSLKSYDSLDKAFLGSAIHANSGNFNLGLAAARTELKSEAGKRYLNSGSIFMSNASLGLGAEAGYGESGGGAIIQYYKNDLSGKCWHYGKSFVNLQSSSYANPDYISYEDDYSGVSFRQPQSGETGAYLSRRLAINGLDIKVSSEIWKPGNKRLLKSENTAILRYDLNHSFRIGSGISRKDYHDGPKNLIRSSLSYIGPVNAIFDIKFQWNDKELENQNSKYFLYLSTPLDRDIVFSGRIRSSFNGKLDYYIEEKTFLTAGFSSKITYRWNSSYKGKLGAFYLIIEGRLD